MKLAHFWGSKLSYSVNSAFGSLVVSAETILFESKKKIEKFHIVSAFKDNHYSREETIYRGNTVW